MIDYRVDIADANAHRYRVTLTVAQPALPLTLSLPVWIPGSYLVREFARHLHSLVARVGRSTATVVAVDKASWRVDAQTTSSAPLTVSYEVYAFDPSVRAAFLDAQRGFFNGTSLLLRVHGRQHEPHAVSIGTLPRGWRVATAMPKRLPGQPASDHRFIAADYDEVVDHPFELGTFWQGEFTARGVPHTFALTGAWPDVDHDRLLRDAQRICETQIDFWHARGSAKARKRDVPFQRYVFMLHAVDDGYGGLEHRASTALIAARADLPQHRSPKAMSEGYITLLGLISHEYFHTWNVKRLVPAELARLDYTRENATALLWFFEGFTSYYDDLLLRRTGLIDDVQYLKVLARQINAVHATPGRHVQSVAQASFDAWIKYYRADENTPNLTVSYYAKGALVALALDLTLRAEGGGSLDAAMRHVWQHAGVRQSGVRSPAAAGDRTPAREKGDLTPAQRRDTGGGTVDETLIAEALQAVAGRSMDRELQAWVHGTDDAPWLAMLAAFGVASRQDATPSMAAALGIRVAEGPVTGVIVKTVFSASAGEQAGLAAGDEILAVDGWRVRKLDDALAWWRPGADVELTLTRRQRLVTLRARPRTDTAAPSTLAPATPCDATTLARRQRWLEG